jgi:TonB family protein
MTTGVALVADASLVTAVGLLVCVALRRRSAALRHMILAASLAAAAAAPVLESTLPQWNVPVLSSAAEMTASDLTLTSDVPVAGAAISGIAEEPRFTWTRMLWGVWALGFTSVMCGLLAGIARLRWVARRCRPLLSRAWREQADALSAQYGLTRAVILLESQDRALLLTWGLFRPRIIVPARAGSWAPERIEVVLAHELAHIVRHDWALQVAADALRAVYWFNPLIWITCRRLRDESEQACDDIVLGRGVNAADYATHLLAVARQLLAAGRGWMPAPAIAGPSTLERRIAAMLSTSRNRAPLTRTAATVTLLAMLGVTVPVAALTLTERIDPVMSRPALDRDVELVAPDAHIPSVALPRRAAAMPRNPAPVAAAARQAAAALSGTVRDASGGVLPGVELTLTDAVTQMQYASTSDGAGRFAFRGLPASRYQLVARLPGFASLLNELTLVGGQDLQRVLELRVGGLQETVTVICASGAAGLPRDIAAPVAAFGNRRTTLRFWQPGDTRVTAPALAAQAAPIRVGGNIMAPRQSKRVAPLCPTAPPPNGGTVVILEGTIGADGLVKEVRSLRPKPGDPSEFAQSAMEAVRQWEFTPTLLNGVPIPVIMTVTVVYQTK